MQASVLVDVYNFLDLAVPGEVLHNVLVLIEDATSVETDFLDVRLYGGWYASQLMTNHASQLVSDLASLRFPMRHPKGAGLLRGKITLVEGPAALAGRQYRSTLKERAGLKRVMLLDGNVPAACVARDSCAVQALRRLARKHTSTCPTASCNVQNQEAFRHKEQKMIDTFLVLDTLHLAARRPHQRVLVASDDLDLVPALDAAAHAGGDVTLIARSAPDLEGLQQLFPTISWRGSARV
jgi:uncharacterized LabA/DUF88 family protein